MKANKKKAQDEAVIKEIAILGEGPSYYANHAEVRINPWDFRFQLGEVTDLVEGRLQIKELARVYMSPSHAKVFSGLLAKKLKQYEEKFGAIPTPDLTEKG